MTWASRFDRLARMAPREIGSRGIGAARRAVDRWRVQSVQPRWHREQLAAALDTSQPPMRAVARSLGRSAWRDAHARLAAHVTTRPPRFLVHPSLREEVPQRLGDVLPEAVADARASGHRVASRRYDLLGYRGLRFDTRPPGEIDWHADPVSGRRAPRECWTDVPYLDPSIGDHKVIWELNRHQHWLTLGRAWWLDGDERFRDAFAAELDSWLRANPPLLGINWASSLELAFRCLSWVWALELFADADRALAEPPWTVDLLLGLDRQLQHVEAHLSTWFSPNTHLLGEALALYVCGAALPELRRSARRVRLGRSILIEQSTRQVLADGGHAERSPHYHRYALEFYLMALAVGRLTRDEALLTALTPVALAMSTFLRHMCDAEGRFPGIGDDDGGELAPIAGRQEQHARATLGWAAALLARPELRIPPVPEAVTWLTLHEPRSTAEARPPVRDDAAVARTALYAETGYLAARRGTSHLVFDVGPHGFLNGGHAHADALSVAIVARGLPLLIDPGTGVYTIDVDVRNRMRSSQFHNTLVLDGHSQSEPAGPFQWATSAGAELRHAALNPSFDYCEADTSAWAPAIHERMVLFVSDDTWVVADRVLGGGRHEAVVRWHLDPAWQPTLGADGQVGLTHAAGERARLAVPGAQVRVLHGDTPGAPGCVSPAYGRFVPSHVIEASVTDTAPFWIVSVIDLLGAREDAGQVRLHAASDARGGGPVAVSARRGGQTDVTICRGRSPREAVTVEIDPGAGSTLTTDARLAHLRVDEAGRLSRLCLADATLLRYDGDRPVTVTAAEPLAELAVLFVEQGRPIVETSAPRRAFSLDVGPPPSTPRAGRPRPRDERPAPASSR